MESNFCFQRHMGSSVLTQGWRAGAYGSQGLLTKRAVPGTLAIGSIDVKASEVIPSPF